MPFRVTRVETSGVIFDGKKAHRDLVKHVAIPATRTAAERGEQMVKSRLESKMKAPTGTYVGAVGPRLISKRRSSKDIMGKTLRVKAWDAPAIIYGPWLESGKYSPPRRFKGYRAWRYTQQRVGKILASEGRAHLSAVVAKWNRRG